MHILLSSFSLVNFAAGIYNDPLSRDRHICFICCWWHSVVAWWPHSQNTDHEGVTFHQAFWSRNKVWYTSYYSFNLSLFFSLPGVTSDWKCCQLYVCPIVVIHHPCSLFQHHANTKINVDTRTLIRKGFCNIFDLTKFLFILYIFVRSTKMICSLFVFWHISSTCHENSQTLKGCDDCIFEVSN